MLHEISAVQSDSYQIEQGRSPNKISAGDSFSNELTRLQEQQVVYLEKLEREKRRKFELEEELENSRAAALEIRGQTKNGQMVKTFERTTKKQVSRLEYKLQTTNVKLSMAKNENMQLKKKIHELRRDKLLSLQVLNDLIAECSDTKRRFRSRQKELLTINDKKHKAKVGATTIKTKMMRDMEDFSNEIATAKQNISNAQQTMLGTIRERMAEIFPTGEDTGVGDQGFSPYPNQKQRGNMRNSEAVGQFGHGEQGFDGFAGNSRGDRVQRKAAIDALLRDSRFETVEELLRAVQTSEEQMFSFYNEIQLKHRETENLELENKRLEARVEQEVRHLSKLEGQNDQVREDLEKSIQALKTNIAKYDFSCSKSMEIINSISESLMNLLRNVAVDEEALDQQLLSTGITDRNVDDYLGLIEQRIDDLIQMSKAASHQSLKREDFGRPVQPVSSGRKGGSGSGGGHGGGGGVFQPPTLPALVDGGADDDNDDDVLDDAVRLQPVNIGVLKYLMQKKVQKIGGTLRDGGNGLGGGSGGGGKASMRALERQMMMQGLGNSSSGSDIGGSRASSTRSLRSNNSSHNSGR